ncbi:DUF2867 domain-containing protein [Streptomyces diastatochromogenes]|uniref:DUF2867 domain-containing protein n=1 Tax=Streptomyces diastatochromogenes TaxID=42236 RepID=A0A233S1S2_STRDA|nr:DUF2867 domain-containing protein [Streptomyces diastatochromogenes]MCZ0991551.1 DUF2867 domain-containing protein [Streptomyces diastatochromogenes]OXY89622.1 hypothetical protein BEK98_36995 [Streptomyces diastatochromogenes]
MGRFRTIRNVHERIIEAPAPTVGTLLDRLSSPHDPIWPAPAWPPVRFDRPLGVGADGGHGFVRYRVSAYEPGRRARFDFNPPMSGHHEFVIEPLGQDRCHVRHTLELQRRGPMLLGWALAVRWMHDTVLEELLDNVERAATGTVPSPVRWSPWIRLLHRLTWDRATAGDLPTGARLVRAAFGRTDYSDAWRMRMRPGMPRDPESWRGVLRGAPFPVVGREGGEVLLGEDAGHLDFRASIHVDDRQVTLSTVVRIHNWRGRLYWAVVKRVHPFMARTMLRRIHRRLALAAPSAAERAQNAPAPAVPPGS